MTHPKVLMYGGSPMVGKSSIARSIAARISCGAFRRMTLA